MSKRKTRESFPINVKKRREGALDRRKADVAKYQSSGDMIKLEAAKSDVKGLMKKLGMEAV
jgi:uncharacterized lipoprotein YajG